MATKPLHEYTRAEQIANGYDVPRYTSGRPYRCDGCSWKEGHCWSPWIGPIATRVVPLRQIRPDGSRVDWSYRVGKPDIAARLAQFGLPPEAAATHGTERVPHELTPDVLQRCVAVNARRWPGPPITPDPAVVGFADPVPRKEVPRSGNDLEID